MVATAPASRQGNPNPRGMRQPAEPLRPIVDPAGWNAGEMQGSGSWVYPFSEAQIAEIMDAVAAIEAKGGDIVSVRREDFPLPLTEPTLREVQDELREGIGFIQLRGLPVTEMTDAQAAIAFWGIGTYFGEALSQNAEGHVLGHVKDLGKDYADPNVRGYQTGAAMTFHTDQCDLVALLCMRTAISGGESRIASSVTLYNKMLKLRPDLAADLCKDFFWTRHGEIPPGAPPWYKLPIFAFKDGYFSARGASTHAVKAQTLPGAEPFSETRKEAVALFRELVEEVAIDVEFKPGDMQILNNHVMLHTRRPYEDWDEPDRKRHLYRLWLRDHDGRPVPDAVRRSFKGIEIEGFKPKAPLDAEEAA